MVIRKEIEIGGRIMSIETGKFAKQADGAVMVRFGDTMVLATVVANKVAKEGQDFFPLQVEYREKTASAGKFPVGFLSVKRGRRRRKFSPHDSLTGQSARCFLRPSNVKPK